MYDSSFLDQEPGRGEGDGEVYGDRSAGWKVMDCSVET